MSMTLDEADKRLRAAEFGVRVVPEVERSFLSCSAYGSADEFVAGVHCGIVVRLIRHPDEEYWFWEDGALCHECYMRLAEREGEST